jgi:hypothetical protein
MFGFLLNFLLEMWFVDHTSFNVYEFRT